MQQPPANLAPASLDNEDLPDGWVARGHHSIQPRHAWNLLPPWSWTHTHTLRAVTSNSCCSLAAHLWYLSQWPEIKIPGLPGSTEPLQSPVEGACHLQDENPNSPLPSCPSFVSQAVDDPIGGTQMRKETFPPGRHSVWHRLHLQSCHLFFCHRKCTLPFPVIIKEKF